MRRVVFPLALAISLAACGGNDTDTQPAETRNSQAATGSAAQDAALAQARSEHDAARKTLDSTWSGATHPDALVKAQAAWEDSLRISCAEVKPTIEQVRCETRLIVARTDELRLKRN